jgi:hypothetical protein
MIRRILYVLLLLLLLLDTGYSFIQHYHQPLDGDLAGAIVPDKDVKLILENPLGITTIMEARTYPNPNRFFSHWFFYKYFNTVPFVLQNFTEPINSVYLACALSKTIIQVMLIFLLGMAVSGTGNVFKLDFIIAAALVTPLFQTNGYNNYMGIIDPSITYTFFYALPCALLLLYFTPFIQQFYHDRKPSAKRFIHILWLPLAVVVCLSGPLNPGVALIFSLLVMITAIRNHYSHQGPGPMVTKMKTAASLIPRTCWFYLLPVCILSAYSLFIGRYNSITITSQIPLGELYSRLPVGIYHQFTRKLGFPVLFLIVIFNAVFIRLRMKNPEGQKVLGLFKWFGIFALAYILLLPLGGYRPYRYYILRYDTIMPVTLGLMFIFGISTLFLLKRMTKRQRAWYIPVIAGIMLLFTLSDIPEPEKNSCERNALKSIAASKEKIVELKTDCTVLSWSKIQRAEDSDLNAQLLTIWGVTREKKLFYNKN